VSGPGERPAASPAPPERPPGADGLKLTTYFGERDRVAGGLLADALPALYGERGLRASVVLRGVEGFGRLHHRRTDRLLTLSEDLPVVSVAVDRRERIEAVLGPVTRLQRRGLITLERARLLGDGLDLAALPPEPQATTTPPGPWEAAKQPPGPREAAKLPPELREAAKLTVYVGRRERVGGAPAFAAVVELLHRRGIDGASVLLGVDGTRGGRRWRARFFARNAEVPLMIVAVGSGERIAAVLPELGGLLAEPLATLERVRVCKRDGELLASPHELPGTDERGLPVWQKLMIYTSQAATQAGQPINVQIVRRLREADTAGATSIRGIWGFHGAHPPHGDRLLQLRRHVPVVTIVVDTPERIGRAFAIVDELTAEHGLVTSEMVPAMTALSAAETWGGLDLASHDF
jgi:PII-like signaling protein